MGKLTTFKIKNEKPGTKEKRVADGNGLFLRIRPSGAKSWMYCFRLPGSRTLQQMTIGTIEEYDLNEAREKRLQFRKLIIEGLDPRKIRAAEVTENAEAITGQTLFDSWMTFLKERKPITSKWLKAHEGRWKNHFKNSLGNILARDITQEHLAKALDAMSSKGIREETRKSLTMLNQLMEYGKKRHLIKDNPARALKPKDFSVSANLPRERFLSLEELRKLWLALEPTSENVKSSKMSILTATALKILILTGARRGEVVAMKWNEINFKNAIWQIPAGKTKNKKAHTIFLSPLTIALLEALITFTGQSFYVFDTGLNARGHIHTDALTRALRRLMKNDTHTKANKVKNKPPLADMEPFTVHDLRRAMATNCAEVLKINPHIIERMLNHQPLNKLIRTYQRATYVEEQKNAWLAWGELVEHQIANELSNVIPLSIKKAI